ncbi:MAG: hypothetical protein ACRDMV_16675 [Streptosporangiales bacterium]
MPTQVLSYGYTLQLTAAGESNADLVSYDPVLSRVRVDLSAAATNPDTSAAFPAGSTWLVQRSVDLVTWTTVRGGLGIPVDAAQLPVDDYAFTSGAESNYRVAVRASDGDLLWTFHDQITVVVDATWWKNTARAFLNQTITVFDYGGVTRPSRNGVFGVVGSSDAIIVSDVAGGRQYTLQILVEDPGAAESFERVAAAGDLIQIQAPPSCDVPSGYYSVGDVSVSRPARKSRRRVFSMPLTQGAPPDVATVAVTTTYYGVLRSYPTYQAVLDANTTYRDLIDRVGAAGTDLP